MLQIIHKRNLTYYRNVSYYLSFYSEDLQVKIQLKANLIRLHLLTYLALEKYGN